ncbi:MAG: hypothetical protein GEV12_23885 [Micromonosporaceae bacterium]|nr:hypothetical protein [Micromonosporaceae bacterium]
MTTANTTTLVYATMTGTDIALYQLDKTYRQLTADGVKIFELAGTAPREADAIDLVSGELRRAWSCAVGGLVPELISRASANARGAITAAVAVAVAVTGSSAGRGLLARRRGR